MSFTLSRLGSFNKDKNEKDIDPSILDGRPVKQGFLVKHKCIHENYETATITNNWKKRWVILINGVMVYYKLPSDAKPKGWFRLEGATVTAEEERTGKACCFGVHTKSEGTFLMVAASTNIFSDWITSIKTFTEPMREPSSSRVSMTSEEQKAPMSSRGSTTDILGRPKAPPISVGLKRVRFKADIQGKAPIPCISQTVFLIDGVRMLVLGGLDCNNNYSGEISVFNLASATWDPYNITGAPPAPRAGHTSNPYQQFVYTFGGTNGKKCFNDVHELNVDELSCAERLTIGTAPIPRHSHSAAVASASLYVIGGIDESNRILNDVHALDLLSFEWSSIDSMITGPKMPPHANQCHSLFDDYIVMFGGRNETGLSNSTFMFSTRDKSWTLEQPKGVPPPPRQHAAFQPFKNRVFFIFGGEGADGLLNDGWVLDVTGYLWIKLEIGGPVLDSMLGMSMCIKDQVMYLFGGKNQTSMTNNVFVLKITDKGLPSINLPAAHRPSIVQRMQLREPKLEDFEIGVVLGTGSFGRVHCVKYKGTDLFYAMKVLKKKEIIQLGQVDHINAERDVLSSISHPHIVNFCGSFQDPKKLYIVMEFVNGGEFFTHLRKAERLKEDAARFYIAEILTALDYLHSNNIVYRDLKPENMLLDSKGHAKITDFGFAKQIDFRTWTLCGTPEYLAPEIILSKGHAKPADWWALGILTFEMVAGYPPFYDNDPLRIYKKILKGDVKWPSHVSAEAKDLITKLLEPDVNLRLGSSKRGAQAIKEHPWFQGIDWVGIENSSLTPPIRPKVKSPGDTSNFDQYQEETDQEWPDCTELENAKFANFG